MIREGDAENTRVDLALSGTGRYIAIGRIVLNWEKKSVRMHGLVLVVEPAGCPWEVRDMEGSPLQHFNFSSKMQAD